MSAGLNGRPTFSFSNNVLTSSGWSISTGRKFAWFSVYNRSTSGTNTYQRIIQANPGYEQGFLGTDSNTFNALAIAGTTNFQPPNAAIVSSTSNPQFLSFAFGTAEAGSNVTLLYVNGSNSASYSGNTGVLGTNGVYIGAGTVPAPADSLIGNISEIICYSGDFTQIQRRQVEGYLAWKWGLQTLLPPTHPYYYIAPNSAGLGHPSALRISAPSQALSPTANTTAFVANTYSGLQVWFDAKDPNGDGTIPANGANISTWVDKSGNGRNATIRTSAGSVTYNTSTNGIAFNGAGSLNSSLSLANTAPLTCFIVLSSASLSAFRSALSINAYGGTRPLMLNVYQSSTNYIWFSGGQGGFDGNTSTTLISANLAYVVANYWSPSSTQVNVNGTSYNASSAAPSSISANATLLIGSTVSGGTPLNEF